MFMDIVFIMLALVLTFSTTMALYIGVFRCSRINTSPGRKAFFGSLSGIMSVIMWGLLYTYKYLGW